VWSLTWLAAVGTDVGLCEALRACRSGPPISTIYIYKSGFNESKFYWNQFLKKPKALWLWQKLLKFPIVVSTKQNYFITYPACIFSFTICSIIFCPRSKIVSMSVVFRVSLPIFAPYETCMNQGLLHHKSKPHHINIFLTLPVAGRSTLTSTTSPSIISVSSLILTPIDFLKACLQEQLIWQKYFNH